jgi:hypothetical protein
MPIDVTCPGCMARFQVSEKFAGKQGPCPKCKKVIKVPELKEQVVIHAPEVSGPKDSTGQLVLKPLTRKEVRLTTPMIVAIVGSVLLVLIAAFVMRIAFPGGKVPPTITILGSILLAPLLAFAGYTFLRDDELEPHRGTALLLRLLACVVVYPLTWGLYWFVCSYLGLTMPNWFVIAGAVAAMIGMGAVAAQASLELEIGNAALHYSMYLVTTVLLRLIMGMDAAWQK